MKTKLLLLLCLLPTIAFGDVYRFYVIHAKTGAADQSKVIPAQLIAAADGDAVSIYAYAEVSMRTNGGRYSCTSELEVADGVDSQGAVTSKAKKKIGTEFLLTESKGDVVSYTFSDTRLVRWQPFTTAQGGLLQPIFKTIKTSNRADIKPESIVVAGTLMEGGITRFYLLERRAEPNRVAGGN